MTNLAERREEAIDLNIKGLVFSNLALHSSSTLSTNSFKATTKSSCGNLTIVSLSI